MNRLEPILEQTRAEVGRRRSETPLRELKRAADRAEAPRAFAQALRRPGLSLIAEHKRRSPSAGAIREDLDLAEVVGAYERAGAAALSILTDGPSFGGSLQDLEAARRASRLPILRKDFTLERYQLYEARAHGADAVLLIVAALGDDELRALHEEAQGLGLAALVEVHDQPELERAAAIGAELIGINNRDLTTLEVDIERTFELLPGVPETAVIVAESGLSAPAQLKRLKQAGLDAVLIGEALMRSADLEAACRALTGF